MTEERKNLINSIFWPSLFVALMWLVKLTELALDTNFIAYGLFPREPLGLMGIATSPLIHKDMGHLISNSLPLLILGTGLFYFYRPIAMRVAFWIVLLGGLWVWVAARQSFHIGASGLIYGLATFLFISGMIRKNRNLLAISFLVAFFYGGMTWGVLPINMEISFEGHLFGAIAGLVCAVYYKELGREDELHDDDDDDDDSGLPWRLDHHSSTGPYWTYQNWTNYRDSQ